MLERPALPLDAPCAAELIAATMGDFGQSLFGFGDRQRLLHALEKLFSLKGNRFSHEYATLTETEGKTAGLLLAFPAGKQTPAQLKMVRALPGIYGWRGALRLLWRALPAAGMREMAKDEFYIAHLATAAEFRRKGVAKFLLQAAERLARAAGLSKLSLIVEPENQPAVNLYLASGFETVKVIQTPWLERGFHSNSHYRMLKKLI